MLQNSKKCNTKDKSHQNLVKEQKYANSVMQIRRFCGENINVENVFTWLNHDINKSPYHN